MDSLPTRYQNILPSTIQDNKRKSIEILLVLVGLGQMLISGLDTIFFKRDLAGDVTNVWLPFANEVIAGGEPYLAHWDNKPPLFHFINILASASDHYIIFFYLTMGIANGLAAVLLWRLCRKFGYDSIGLVASVIFLAFLVVSSFRINPRQYATVFILLSLMVESSFKSGIYIAVAGLFSQFSVLIIPAILMQRIWVVVDFRRWATIFVLSGLGTVIVVFGLVALIWSVDSAVAGFNYSFLSSGGYTEMYIERDISLFGDPLGWFYREYRMFRDWMLLLFGGIAGSLIILLQDNYNRSQFGTLIVSSAILLLSQTTIRPAPVYSVAWLPFFAVLTAIMMDYLIRRNPITESYE